MEGSLEGRVEKGVRVGVIGLEFGVGVREGGGALHARVTKSWMMMGGAYRITFFMMFQR